VVPPQKPRQAAPGLEETKDQRAEMRLWALDALLELQWPMGLLDSQGVVSPFVWPIPVLTGELPQPCQSG